MTAVSLIDVARSWKWPIVGAAILGAVGGYLLGFAGTGTATATVPIAVSDDAIGQAGGEGYTVDELRQVVSAMVESTKTVGQVEAETGIPADSLRIAAESETRSPVVSVAVTAAEPDDALGAAAVIAGILAAERQRLFEQHHLDGGADSEGQEMRVIIEAAGQSVQALDEPTLRRGAPTPIVLAGLGSMAAATAVFGLVVLVADRRRERSPWRDGLLPGPEVWQVEEDEEPQALLLAEQGADVPVVPETQLDPYDWILERVLGPSVKVLAVAGADNEDGTGLTAVALATAYANRGQVAALFSLSIPPSASSADELSDGLEAVVKGEMELSDALIALESPEGLLYLPPGDFVGSRWGTDRRDQVRNQIDMTQGRGVGLVILELPPILSLADPTHVLDLADGVVLSSVRRSTDPVALAEARRAVRRSSPMFLGEVNHRSQLSRPLFVRRSSGRGAGSVAPRSVA